MKPAKSFFIPRTTKSQYETAYELMKSVVKYQMGWTVTDRRIESLSYTSGKQSFTAKVGQLGEIEHQHEVVAIMEAALFLIITKTTKGEPGPTILVDAKDVTAINDFKEKAEKLKPVMLPTA